MKYPPKELTASSGRYGECRRMRNMAAHYGIVKFNYCQKTLENRKKTLHKDAHAYSCGEIAFACLLAAA